MGPDTLLYIGQADRSNFGDRITSHQDEWGRWNPSELSIYVGRLMGETQISEEDWGRQIDQAEAILIWKLGVPYNSDRIKSCRYAGERVLVVNHNRRHRLPELVSTLTEHVNTSPDGGLKAFGEPDNVSKPKAVPNEPMEIR